MANTPYSAIDVANYIVWYANEMDKPVTHLKLQKLLYYVVAKYAKDYNRLLIDENFVKWQYGPVVTSVYHYFKLYGNSNITQPVAYLTSTEMFRLGFADVEGKRKQLGSDGSFVESLKYVLNELLDKSPFELVERTHQETAWRNSEAQILQGRDLFYSLNELKSANI